MKKIILLLMITSSVWAQQAKKSNYGITEFILIEKVEDQEKKYNNLLKEPLENLAPTALNDLRAELALAWLSKGNVDKYRYYKSTSPKFSFRQGLYLGYALEKLFDEKRDYINSEKISKELLNDLTKGTLGRDAIRPSVLFEINAAANAKLGNIEDAKTMIAKSSEDKSSEERLIKYFKDMQSNYLNRQAIVMLAAGDNQNAFDILNKAFTEAESNPYMVETFKDAFQKVKGTTQGFEEYLNLIRAQAYQKYYKEVLSHYVSEPQKTINGTFPDPNGGTKMITSFQAKIPMENVALKSLDGKTVNLKDYKGRILVLDFWTTVCTPCIAAFAGFEKVLSDYSKDELNLFVVNIFEENATVKAYAAQKPIKLNILQDQENSAFNVAATPTKIIFDPAGNIRFFSSAYAGSTDREYYKLKAMIEITKSRTLGKTVARSR